MLFRLTLRLLVNAALDFFWTRHKTTVALATVGLCSLIDPGAYDRLPLAVTVAALAAMDATAWLLDRLAYADSPDETADQNDSPLPGPLDTV